MNKWVRVTFGVSLAAFKYLILKVQHGKNISWRLPSLVSPATEISIDAGGLFTAGKKLKMRNGAKLRVRKTGVVKIGLNFGMNNGCILTCYESVTIGDNVMLGPNVLIYDHDHDFRVSGGIEKMQYITSPIQIGNNVWIGANTVILRGTKLGDNCVVGASSVIKGEYPNNSVIVQKRETKVTSMV